MTLIRFRRNTSAGWNSSDPVLTAGEPAIETDTNRLYIGDGDSAISELQHFPATAEIQNLIQTAVANAGTGTGISLDDVMVIVNAHVNSLTPHPVYDDGPSLSLLYQNAKV